MKKILLSLFLLVMMIVPGMAKDETYYCWKPKNVSTYLNYVEANSTYLNLSNRCATDDDLEVYEISKSIYDKAQNILNERKEILTSKFKSGEISTSLRSNRDSEKVSLFHKETDQMIADLMSKNNLRVELKNKKNEVSIDEKKSNVKLQSTAEKESKFSKKCEGGVFSKGYKKGTEEFNDCVKREEKLAALDIQKRELMNEEKNKKIALEENKKQKAIQQKQELEQAKIKEEQTKISKMKPEDRNAYTCSEKFGFRKGSDKFKDCIFELYKAEAELEKLELQKQVAKANADAARANAEAARAGAERQERLALAQTEAAKMQALAARQQAIAANTADSLALINQGLSMMSPQRPAPRMQTTCTYTGRFMNCF